MNIEICLFHTEFSSLEYNQLPDCLMDRYLPTYLPILHAEETGQRGVMWWIVDDDSAIRYLPKYDEGSGLHGVNAGYERKDIGGQVR